MRKSPGRCALALLAIPLAGCAANPWRAFRLEQRLDLAGLEERILSLAERSGVDLAHPVPFALRGSFLHLQVGGERYENLEAVLTGFAGLEGATRILARIDAPPPLVGPCDALELDAGAILWLHLPARDLAEGGWCEEWEDLRNPGGGSGLDVDVQPTGAAPVIDAP